MAPASAVMAIPASSMVITDVPVLRVASTYTKALAARPPANAPAATTDKPNHCAYAPAEAPNTIARLAPSEAPLVTPMMDGSASGLRNRPCMTAPDKASTAPTTKVSAVRGARSSHSTTIGSGPLVALPAKAASTSPGEMPAGPVSRLAIAASALANASTPSASGADLRIDCLGQRFTE